MPALGLQTYIWNNNIRSIILLIGFPVLLLGMVFCLTLGMILAGMLLCVVGVIGLWGIGFFSPELVGPVIERSLREQHLAPEKIAGAKTYWIGLNSIFQNIGAFFGMLFMARIAQSHGRKPAFAVAFIAALTAVYGIPLFVQQFVRTTHR